MLWTFHQTDRRLAEVRGVRTNILKRSPPRRTPASVTFRDTSDATRRAPYVRFRVTERPNVSIPSGHGSELLWTKGIGTTQYSDYSSSVQGPSHAHTNPSSTPPNTPPTSRNHDATCTFRCYLDDIRCFPGWCGTRNEDANQEAFDQDANQAAFDQDANQEASDQDANQAAGDQAANQETAHHGADQDIGEQVANQKSSGMSLTQSRIGSIGVADTMSRRSTLQPDDGCGFGMDRPLEYRDILSENLKTTYLFLSFWAKVPCRTSCDKTTPVQRCSVSQHQATVYKVPPCAWKQCNKRAHAVNSISIENLTLMVVFPIVVSIGPEGVVQF